MAEPEEVLGRGAGAALVVDRRPTRWSGNAVESTRTIGRPARRICSDLGVVGRQADRDDAVHRGPADRPRERPVERRDEVERVAAVLGHRRDALAERRRRTGSRRSTASAWGVSRPIVRVRRWAEHPGDRVAAGSRACRRPRGSGSRSRRRGGPGLLNANDTAVFETPAASGHVGDPHPAISFRGHPCLVRRGMIPTPGLRPRPPRGDGPGV